jgi:hypothetical protein
MLKVWVGLEARSFLQASIETVSIVDVVLKSMLTNLRWNDASSMTSFHQTFNTIPSYGIYA